MRIMPLGVAGVVMLLLTGFGPAKGAGFSARGNAAAQTFSFQSTGNTSYVWQASPSPAFPYTTWATAAHVIQDAIDAAGSGDTILVTNGVYASGGMAVAGLMTNRVALNKSVAVQSVNGPGVTAIAGDALGAVRCAYVDANAILIGFTLTNGATRQDGDTVAEQSGGGVWSESSGVVSNCVISGNSCGFGAGAGAYGGMLYSCMIVSNSAKIASGGAASSILYDCTLTGNSGWLRAGGASASTLYNCALLCNKAQEGGGLYNSDCYNCSVVSNRATYGAGASGGTFRNCILNGNQGTSSGGGVTGGILFNCLVTGNTARRGGGAIGTLYNCTLAGNSAFDAGGAVNSTLFNSIVYYNTAGDSGPNYETCAFSYSCATPLPPGPANFNAEPGFVNLGNGDYHLRYGSPCIDAGTNLSAWLTNDVSGLLRPLDGQGGGAALFDVGAYEFDLRTLVPLEWFAQYGLDSNDPAVLSQDPDHDGLTTFQEWVTQTNPTNAASCFRTSIEQAGTIVRIRVPSATNRLYSLYYCTNIALPSWQQVPGQQNLPGTVTWPVIFQDANVEPARFYKVAVDFPH